LSLRNNPTQQEFAKKKKTGLLQNLVKNATPRKHIRFMYNYKTAGRISHAVFTISTLQVTYCLVIYITHSTSHRVYKLIQTRMLRSDEFTGISANKKTGTDSFNYTMYNANRVFGLNLISVALPLQKR
jgi:hypothetical protein